jgi:UDP-glucose 4-epimerase
MEVLVTGATGFIGRQLLDRLVAREDAVRALVRPRTLADVMKRRALSEDVQPIPGSLTDTHSLARATTGVELVYHLATIRSSDPRSLADVNVKGTENVLRACARAGVRRIVFSSSVAVYGWRHLPRDWPISERDPTDPRGPYARSKVAAENLIRRCHNRDRRLEHVVLRLPIVYGVGAPIFDDFVRGSLKRPAMVAGRGGSLVYQPIHVRDAAEALMLAGTRETARAVTLNVAGDELVSNGKLVAMVRAAAAETPPRPRRPGPQGDRRTRLQFDIRRAREVLGFWPQIELRQGLAEVVARIANEPSNGAPSRRRRPVRIGASWIADPW